MSTSTAEDVEAIWEEVICDSLADMNVFSGSKAWAEAAENMGMTIPAVQKAVSEGKANQTRGSPEASLSHTRDGKNGWGNKFGTAQEALNDAIQSVDTKLWNSFNKEFDSNITNHPITNAINAVMQDVRQDKIKPMQGAMLLSQTYEDGGVDAISKLYNHKTGNLHDNVLDEAKQIGEGKASREFASHKKKGKVPQRDDFATNAMIWAYSTKTDIGEQKIFYRKNNWVLLEKTNDGFIKLGQYNSNHYDFINEEVSKHNEGLYNSGIDERIYSSIMRYENLGINDSRNYGNDVGQQTSNGRIGEIHQEQSESNRSGDNKGSKQNKGAYSRELDTAYLDAVKSGDMETAQKMVDTQTLLGNGITIK